VILIKRIGKYLAVLVVMLALGWFVSHQYVNHVEKARPVVKLSAHSSKVLFFYRDDCTDCQAIFHQIYWHNVVNRNIVFVNMNQQQNRQYIQQYQLTAVPTLIHGNQRYTGTNQQRIKQIVGD